MADTGWLPATVPGHVHLDLHENGIIAHPFERMHELGSQWVDQCDWSYRTNFEWHPDEDLPRRILRFEGLDTLCKVFLNDEPIAEHENMFVPLEIDVTDALLDGQNRLQVEFGSAVRAGEARKEAFLRQEKLSPETPHFYDRSFVRKAQYMYGWDWGPRLASCGVWRPVALLEYAARIVEVHVKQKHLASGAVQLEWDVEPEGHGCIVGIHTFDPEGELVDEFVDAHPGDVVTIESPRLWDPATPNLYQISISLSSIVDRKSGETIELHDTRHIAVGLARTQLVREPDAFGESFEFKVNGRRTWMKGANWIPDHSFPSIVGKAQYRDRLEKAKNLGFNMLRVWGGGLYETNEFYDLCDELGILVWQDFAFACAYYPDDAHWQAVIREEATVNIKRLRNHASLALWCGNNENAELHANWSRPPGRPDHFYGANHYDHVLPELVAEFDPGRSYIPSSPIGEDPNNDGKAAKQTGPNSGGFGDQHCWDVWHGRGDWKYYADSTGRFSSEYGFVSSCTTSLWAKTIGASDWDPHSAAVKWHDKTGKGDDVFHGYVELHYPSSKTLEDWVYYSQLNQRDALRFGIEHYRRSEFCRGSLIWQFNDCWPVQSWAVLDSDGDYKALAYELRRLYDDRLLSILRDGDKIAVWAVNDSKDRWEDEIVLLASSLSSGQVLSGWSESVNLPPDSRGLILEASIHGFAAPDTIVTAADADSGYETWQLLSEPKSVRLPAPEPLVVSTVEDGALTIMSTTALIDLMLTEYGSPSPFLDNFVTTPLPGLLKIDVSRVPMAIEARSLAGVHPVRMTRSPI